MELKKKQGELEMENAMEYHCDRGKFVDMSSVEMLYFCRGDLNDPYWHFPKAISRLESIPLIFHYNYCHVLHELEEENRRSQ